MSSASALGFNAREQNSAGLDGHARGPRAWAMADAEAEFTWFFRAEFSRVVRTVFLILNDRGRAEEIAQDAFIQLLDHWGKVSSYEQPDAWVRRVAIRMAGRAARRERMRGLLEGRFRPVVATPPPDEPGNEVLRAVRSLPPNQRTAVVLFYFEDRPIAEIADVLGCSPATARVHLHKARQRLAALLHEEVDDVA
jgi:DNA-directed RNA polymerase specialized sigma24 family protein